MTICLAVWHGRPGNNPLNATRCACLSARRAAANRSRAELRIAYSLLELVIVLAIISTLAAVSMPALMRPWSKSQVQQAAQELSRTLLRTRLDSIQHGTAYQFRWRPATGEYEVIPWNSGAARDARDGPPVGTADAPPPVPFPTAPMRSPTQPATGASSRQSTGQATGPTKRQQQQRPSGRPQPQTVRGRLANQVVFSPPDQTATPLVMMARNATPPPSQPTVAARQATPPVRKGSDRSGQDAALSVPQVAWTEPVWFFPDGRTSSAEWTLRAEDGYSVQLSLRGLTGTIRVGVVKRIEPATAEPRQPLDQPPLRTPATTAGQRT